MTLEQLYDHAMIAAEGLFEMQGEVHTMYLCEDKQGNIFPLMPPPGMPRDILPMVLKQFLREYDVVRYAALQEAWMVPLPYTGKDAEQARREVAEAYRKYGSLKHHPDRIEAVTVLAEEPGRSIYGYFQILRPEHGPAKLAPASEPATINAGHMAGMFDDQATRH